MGRKAQLEPRWLVGLLNVWAIRSSVGKGLGYPTTCPMLREGIPRRATSYEPTGYCDQDVTDVEACVNRLDEMRKLSVMRYFKPWSRGNIDILWKRDNDTWMYHLRIALDEIRVGLAEIDEKRLASANVSGYIRANV